MLQFLTYGNCTNWKLAKTEAGTLELYCSSTGKALPLTLDAEGGLVLPEGVTFEEEKTTTATA